MLFRPSIIVSIGALIILSMADAFTIHFRNNCAYTVWPAVGRAPYGQPDNSVRFGTRLARGGQASFSVADTQTGIRAWGRTGCNSSGANCKTGACNGGLECTDAGITAKALFSEFGLGGSNREYWDLSYVGGSINVPARLTGPDGQSVLCQTNNCPSSQAFHNSDDYQALRNSPEGGTYTHLFCP